MTTYYCKCGREVKKSTKAATTGNRDTEGCTGCPYLLPYGPYEWNKEQKRFTQTVAGHECRMTEHPVDYASHVSSYGGPHDKTVLHIESLDFDFLNRVCSWVKETFSEGELSGSFDRTKLRPADYMDGVRVTFCPSQNKKGAAAKQQLFRRFFHPDGTRLDMTPEEERTKVLADIAAARAAASGKEPAMDKVYKDCRGMMYKIGSPGGAWADANTVMVLDLEPGSKWHRMLGAPKWPLLDTKAAEQYLTTMAVADQMEEATEEEIMYNQLQRAELMELGRQEGMTEAEINTALCDKMVLLRKKLEVQKFFLDKPTEEAAADFLCKIYGTGSCDVHAGKEVWNAHYDDSGLRIAKSGSAAYTPDVSLSWEEAAHCVADLVDEGKYLDVEEQATYRQWIYEKSPQTKPPECTAEEIQKIIEHIPMGWAYHQAFADVCSKAKDRADLNVLLRKDYLDLMFDRDNLYIDKDNTLRCKHDGAGVYFYAGERRSYMSFPEVLDKLWEEALSYKEFVGELSTDETKDKTQKPAVLSHTTETAVSTKDSVEAAGANTPALEDTQTVFDYGEDAETNAQLVQCAQAYVMGKLAMVMAVKRAHTLTANHKNGTFGKWCASVGISRDKGNQLVNIADNFGNIEIDGQPLVEIAPLSLLAEAAKPSTPKQIQAQVAAGDITSRKEYKDALARIKALEQAKNDAEQKHEEAFQAAHGFHVRAEKAEQECAALLDQQAEYIGKIQSMESELGSAKKAAEQAARESAELKARAEDACRRYGEDIARVSKELEESQNEAREAKEALAEPMQQPVVTVVDQDEVQRLAEQLAEKKISSQRVDALAQIVSVGNALRAVWNASSIAKLCIQDDGAASAAGVLIQTLHSMVGALQQAVDQYSKE